MYGVCVMWCVCRASCVLALALAGVDELCSLTKQMPCPSMRHEDCVASITIEAYSNLKVSCAPRDTGDGPR